MDTLVAECVGVGNGESELRGVKICTAGGRSIFPFFGREKGVPEILIGWVSVGCDRGAEQLAQISAELKMRYGAQDFTDSKLLPLASAF